MYAPDLVPDVGGFVCKSSADGGRHGAAQGPRLTARHARGWGAEKNRLNAWSLVVLIHIKIVNAVEYIILVNFGL